MSVPPYLSAVGNKSTAILDMEAALRAVSASAAVTTVTTDTELVPRDGSAASSTPLAMPQKPVTSFLPHLPRITTVVKP